MDLTLTNITPEPDRHPTLQHTWFGIGDERIEELIEKLTEVCHIEDVQGHVTLDIVTLAQAISAECRTPEELFCMGMILQDTMVTSRQYERRDMILKLLKGK